jgi:hypothetical protein
VKGGGMVPEGDETKNLDSPGKYNRHTNDSPAAGYGRWGFRPDLRRENRSLPLRHQRLQWREESGHLQLSRQVVGLRRPRHASGQRYGDRHRCCFGCGEGLVVSASAQATVVIDASRGGRSQCTKY